jgi:hypothetical protein
MKKHMKKQYTIIASLLAVMMIFGYASVAQKQHSQSAIQNKAVTSMQTSQLSKIKNVGNSATPSKSTNAIIWQDDFSVSSHWTISNEVANTDNWVIGTAGPAGGYAISPIASTTAANGFALFDSDNMCSGNQIGDITNATAFSCTGHSLVGVKFEQYYRRYYDSTYVCVSTNGTTWTKFRVNKSLANNAYCGANPTTTTVNISSVAANQATVYIRFQFWSPTSLGTNAGCGYSWMIDDVSVFDLLANDVALTATAKPNEYMVKPVAQYTPAALTLSATAENKGASAATNVFMNVNVYNLSTLALVHAATSNTLATLASFATGTLTATTSYTPPKDTSIYLVEYIIHMTQTDGDLSNDTLYHGFWVSDSLYARSDEMYTTELDGALGFGAGTKGLLGSDFTLTVADKLSRVDAFVTGPAIGDTTQFFVYSTNASGLPLAQIGSSAIYKFTTAGPQWVSLPISGGPLSLAAGTYYVALKEFTATDNIGLGYTDDNYTPLKSYLQIGTAPFDTLDNYSYFAALMIEPYLVCASFMTDITASNDTICAGTPTTLTALNGTSYSWASNPVGFTSTLKNPVVSPTVTTTYTVTVTNTYGCTDTDSQIITVIAPPAAYNVTGTGAYCSGGTGLAVGLSSSQIGVNYQLQANGVNSGSPVPGTGSAISFGNQTSAGTYTVIATNPTTSCTNTMTGSAVITITTTPVAFVVSGTTAICSGTSTSITLSGSANGVNYQLYNGAATVGSAVPGTGSAITFLNISAAGTYTVIGTAGTCTTNMTSNAVITVNPNPSANAGTDQSITTGTSTTLAGSASGSTGPYNYLWSPAGSLVAANVQNPTTTSLIVTTTYTLTVTDQVTGCSGTDQIVVTVTGGVLSATCPAASGPICQGSSIPLSTIVSGGTLPYAYLWTSVPVDPTLSSQNTLPGPVVTPSVNTVYTVVVTDGASNSVSCSVSITVDPTMVTTTTETDATCGSSDGTATVSVTSGGTPTFNYVWDSSPAQTTATATGLPQGTYNVTVTDVNGCTAANTVTVNCTVGTTEYSNSANFSIAPNPSNGSFSIVLNGYNGKATYVNIFDIKGQLLFNENWAVNSDVYIQKINLENLDKGVYYVRLVTKGSIKTVKLVIE